jgi:hypothetical protein
MPDPEGRLPEKLQAAREAFDEFLSRERAEAGAGFEDLCARHPDLTEELRKLRSVSQLAQAAFPSVRRGMGFAYQAGRSERCTQPPTSPGFPPA